MHVVGVSASKMDAEGAGWGSVRLLLADAVGQHDAGGLEDTADLAVTWVRVVMISPSWSGAALAKPTPPRSREADLSSAQRG